MSAVDPSSDRPDAPTAPVGDTARGPAGWSLVVLTTVVVAVLAAPIVVAVVHAALGGSDSGSSSAASTVSTTPTRSGPSSGSASARPSATPDRSAACWDGSRARRVAACSEPTGAAGLSWVFPSLAGQRCGKPTDTGPAGAVLRQVCRVRLDGGGRAVVVYAQWDSSADAVTYVRSKGLARTAGAGSAGVRRFATAGAATGQAAAVYADEPFGYIVTTSPGSDPVATAAQVVRSRPSGQVRGERAR